jgi:predicted KAP-like P-loop ATPase
MKNIVITILSSFVFVFCVAPFLQKITLPNGYQFEATIKSGIGIICTTSIFIILFWNKGKRFCQRYINTCKLPKPYLIYPEYIFIFITSSCLLTLISEQGIIIKTSLGVWSFIGLNIFLLIGCVFIYLTKYRKKENVLVDDNIISLSDEPAKQDGLGRDQFVNNLYKDITCLPFDDSFVFGLYGKWGEGKTSVIYFLQEKLKDNNDFLVINFDPWYFKDEEAIMSAFYREIERSINKELIFPNLKKAFNKYLKIASSGFLKSGIMNSLAFGEESIEEVKQRIEFYIEQIGTKLLIIIDDIDRLQAKEILLILKLVRLNTKFRNTIFLLSFDQVVVQEVLKGTAKTDHKFLEKIVQRAIPLPAIEQNKIDELIFSYLEKLFDEINIADDERLKFEKEFYYLYKKQARRLFKTLRDAKRYINGLCSTLPSVKTEVCIYDFCILEIIRTFYPKAYNDIWTNPWFYIPISMSSSSKFASSPFPIVDDKNVIHTLIKEHIGKLFEDENEREILQELLEAIFFITVKSAFSKYGSTYRTDYGYENREEKRITHHDSFRKYFMLKVPLSEISDEFMETTLEFWNLAEKSDKEHIIQKKIYELEEDGKLSEFFQKLIVFTSKIDTETIPEIIRGIYKNPDKFINEKDPFSRYHDLTYPLLTLINNKIEVGKIQLTIEEVITKTPLLPFAVHFVMYCRKDGTGSHYNLYRSIEYDRIHNLVCNRLRKHFIVEKRNIFEEWPDIDFGFVLYQWSSNWTTFTGDNKDIVDKYLQALFSDDCKSFAKLITRMQEMSPLGDEYTFNIDKYDKVYDLKKFKLLANKYKDDKSLMPTEKKAMELFVNTPLLNK